MSESNRTPLWKEITIILVIKAAALYLIWLAFFSHPIDKQLAGGGIASSPLKPAPPPATPPSR